MKPALKKVSKYENRFKKQAAPAAEKQDIRANLKAVKKESVFTQLASKVIAFFVAINLKFA